MANDNENNIDSLEDIENLASDSMDISYPGLELIEGPEEGLFFNLKSGENILGRSRQHASLRVEDTSVSRRHIKIFKDGNQVTIQDLGSRNGTKLNGEKLDPDDEVILNHLDQVDVGLYRFIYLTKPQSERDINPPHLGRSPVEEESLDQEEDDLGDQDEVSDQHFVDPPPGDNDDDEVENALAPIKNLPTTDETFLAPTTPKKKRWFGYLIFFLLLMIICGLGLYYYPTLKNLDYKNLLDSSLSSVEEFISDGTEVIDPDNSADPYKLHPNKEESFLDQLFSFFEDDSKKIEQNMNQNQNTTIYITELGNENTNQKNQIFPAFLDVTSSPLPAEIFFQGKSLGFAPFQSEVSLKDGEKYSIKAIFYLKEINQQFEHELEFKASKNKNIIPLDFKVELGQILIKKLPRYADIYLEAQFAHQPTKNIPIRIIDIVYNRPFYLPYGSYNLELKEKKRIGDLGPVINQVSYSRKFILSKENSEYEIIATDEDLDEFPAFITSIPSKAQVFFNGEKIGITPFKGNLSQGINTIKLVKDGYFDHTENIEIKLNTPYELEVKLKTSVAGRFLNEGKNYYSQSRYQLATESLAKALKEDPTEEEKGEIYLYLGRSSFERKNYEQAFSYFYQASKNPFYQYQGITGLALVYHAQGNKRDSLKKITEVFLNVQKEHETYQEAVEVFQKIVGMSSVLYINTLPEGADVFINENPVGQATPVILSGLQAKNYNIELKKVGYKTKFIRQDVGFNIFVPLIVELEKSKEY